MFNLVLFGVSLVFSGVTLSLKKKWNLAQAVEIFLSYILLFNLGLMCVLAAYAHVFMGPEIAREIGWESGSPFQFEMGMANLAFGVLGILAFWIRGNFWTATIIGWNVLFLGCFVGHVIDYYRNNNTAPYNIGPNIWLSDLILPLAALIMWIYLKQQKVSNTKI